MTKQLVILFEEEKCYKVRSKKKIEKRNEHGKLVGFSDETKLVETKGLMTLTEAKSYINYILSLNDYCGFHELININDQY